MKLWLFERHGNVGWDEYIGFVVRAKSREAAEKIVSTKLCGNGVHGKPYVNQFTIEELTVAGKPGIILESFNAG